MGDMIKSPFLLVLVPQFESQYLKNCRCTQVGSDFMMCSDLSKYL